MLGLPQTNSPRILIMCFAYIFAYNINCSTWNLTNSYSAHIIASCGKWVTGLQNGPAPRHNELNRQKFVSQEKIELFSQPLTNLRNMVLSKCQKYFALTCPCDCWQPCSPWVEWISEWTDSLGRSPARMRLAANKSAATVLSVQTGMQHSSYYQQCASHSIRFDWRRKLAEEGKASHDTCLRQFRLLYSLKK